MRNVEKLAQFIAAELEAQGFEKSAIEKESGAMVGRLFGAVSRGVSRVVGGGARAARGGAGAVGRFFKGQVAAARAAARPGVSMGMARAVGRQTARPAMAAPTTSAGRALQSRVTAGRGVDAPLGKSVRAGLAKRWTPGGGTLRKGKAPLSATPRAIPTPASPARAASTTRSMAAARRGRTPAPAAPPKTPGGGMGVAGLMAVPMVAGGGGERAASSTENILKVGLPMTDEQVGKIISEAMERGFADQLVKEAKKHGYKGTSHKKPMKKKSSETEKTAEIGQKKDGILFTKFTPQDLIQHLASQFGRPEPIEKEASQKTPREKLASMVEAELARPS